MRFPRKVYAIFPCDKDGEAVGVYVGSTSDMKWRLINHRCRPVGLGNQDELHQLMRENGCTYKFLDEYYGIKETHTEYDWIDYFVKVTDLKVFNNRTDYKGADWTRISSTKLENALSGPFYYYGKEAKV